MEEEKNYSYKKFKDPVDKTPEVDKPVIKNKSDKMIGTEPSQDLPKEDREYIERINKRAERYLNDPNEDREYRDGIDKRAKQYLKYLKEDAKKEENEEEPKKEENEEEPKKEENEDFDISLTPAYKEICNDLSKKQEDYDNILNELKQTKAEGQAVLRILNSPSTGTAGESNKDFLQNKLDSYKDRYEELREDFCDIKAELCDLRNQKAKMLDSIDIESVFGITSDKIPSQIGGGQDNIFIEDPHNKETSMFFENFQNKTCLTRDESLLFTIDDNGNIGRKVNYQTLEEADLDGNGILDSNEINTYVKSMSEQHPDAIKVFDAKENIRNELGILYAEKGDNIPSSYKYGFIKGTQNYESSPDDRYYVDFNATKFGGNDFYNFIKDPETGNVDPKHVDEFYNRYNLDNLDSLKKLKEDMNSGKTLSDFVIEDKPAATVADENIEPGKSDQPGDGAPIGNDGHDNPKPDGQIVNDGTPVAPSTIPEQSPVTKPMSNGDADSGIPAPDTPQL